jgi:hypothetical protein
VRGHAQCQRVVLVPVGFRGFAAGDGLIHSIHSAAKQQSGLMKKPYFTMCSIGQSELHAFFTVLPRVEMLVHVYVQT